jgi:hypothetical protein
VVNPADVRPYERVYRGTRLLVVNRGKQSISVLRYDRSSMMLCQEALDKQGKWRPIEYFRPGWCGVGFRFSRLHAGRYWDLIAPRYSGRLHTKLRFALTTIDPRGVVYYSNEFEGSINPEQFEEPKQP